jgi:sulfate ABC transporter ATP-binding protein
LDIRVQDIRKEFSRYPALNEVSLEIKSGELIALLGPSGSGKTTLLRLIAGLETPTAGRIFFGDEDASSKSVQERNVGFVFQAYALFRNMTVLENISFGLKVRPRATRPPAAEIRRRAMELLDLVQLTGLHKRFPQQLSGGQRQRVALARALAIEPRVLLLDEPFGALDAQVRKELRKWLREIHDHTGHTTVFVTHDQEEALELADRLVVMSQGKIEQVGTPDDVYDRPTPSSSASSGNRVRCRSWWRTASCGLAVAPSACRRRMTPGASRACSSARTTWNWSMMAQRLPASSWPRGASAVRGGWNSKSAAPPTGSKSTSPSTTRPANAPGSRSGRSAGGYSRARRANSAGPPRVIATLRCHPCESRDPSRDLSRW